MKQTNWHECNAPIKLSGNEDDDPFEEEIDRLRQKKDMEQKLKLQQEAIFDHNKKAELLRQQIVKDILPKHKGLKLAYDYDGSYMLAKDLQQLKNNQRAPEIHKITQIDTIFQPQKPIQQAVIENINVKKDLKNNHKSKTNPTQLLEITSQKPFESFLPNQGVKLIYSDQNVEIIKESNDNQWGDGQRMTKKQFEAMKGEQHKTLNQNILKNQMLQKINADIAETVLQKTTPSNNQKILNNTLNQQLSQSSKNLFQQTNTQFENIEKKQQQQTYIPQNQQKQNKGSKINVVDRLLLDQLLS